jgi:hypothetical protein
MTNKLEEIVSLIKSGESNEACKIFYINFKKDLSAYLIYRLKWSVEEADIILNDAYILLSNKISEGSVERINLSYIKELCKYIGANQYRKNLREEKKLKGYFEESKRELETDFYNTYNIEIDLNDDNFHYKEAIRTFSILDEKCQKLIKMKHVEDLRHEEIIKKIREIGNIDSSKSLLNRCMNKWRKLINVINTFNH